MRYVWDWYHNYLEENKIGYGIKGLYIRNLLKNVRVWDKVAADRVDLWLAQSQTAQKRIKKYYGKDSLIINPPVPVEKIKISSDLPDKYYLIVSRLEPYKKIDLAIRTFNQNNKRLVIIGVGSDEKRLKEMAKENIEFLGWQSDGAIYEYMRNSYAYIFPGEEDFGITPVESMASGRPVLAYKKGGVVETVVEGKTGYFFENETVDDLNQAIERLEKNYKLISPIECRRQAEKFGEKVFLGKMAKVILD
jgi:glycosyltransferase involved in cell wall biosynthesis